MTRLGTLGAVARVLLVATALTAAGGIGAGPQPWWATGAAFAQDDDGGDDDGDDGGDDDGGDDDGDDGNDGDDDGDDGNDDGDDGPDDDDPDDDGPDDDGADDDDRVRERRSFSRDRDDAPVLRAPSNRRATTSRPARAPAPVAVPRPVFAPGEIVVTNLGDTDLATLQTEGFAVIERVDLANVAVVLHRLQVPRALTLEQARDRVRAQPTGGTGDFNHYYRSEQDTLNPASAAPSPQDATLQPAAIPAARSCTHLNCAALDLIGWPADRDAAPAVPRHGAGGRGRHRREWRA